MTNISKPNPIANPNDTFFAPSAIEATYNIETLIFSTSAEKTNMFS